MKIQPEKGYCPIENKEKVLFIGYEEREAFTSIDCIKKSHNCEKKECDKFNNCPIFSFGSLPSAISINTDNILFKSSFNVILPGFLYTSNALFTV